MEQREVTRVLCSMRILIEIVNPINVKFFLKFYLDKSAGFLQNGALESGDAITLNRHSFLVLFHFKKKKYKNVTYLKICGKSNKQLLIVNKDGYYIQNMLYQCIYDILENNISRLVSGIVLTPAKPYQLVSCFNILLYSTRYAAIFEVEQVSIRILEERA